MANCCITRDIIRAGACNAGASPGVVTFYFINKKDVLPTSVTFDTCGNINGISLCSYPQKCIYQAKLENDTQSYGEAWTRTGGTYKSQANIEGDFKFLSCADRASIEQLVGAELIVIVNSRSGTWEIGGWRPGGGGFLVDSYNRESGKTPDDDMTATLRLTQNGTPTDSWKFFLLGSDSDSQEVREALTAEWIANNLCSNQQAETCGCSGE